MVTFASRIRLRYVTNAAWTRLRHSDTLENHGDTLDEHEEKADEFVTAAGPATHRVNISSMGGDDEDSDDLVLNDMPTAGV